MSPLYDRDLAWIQARAFGGQARGSAPYLVRRLRDAGVHSVLEIGCGAGPLTRALLEAGFAVTAIDPSPALLEHARAAAPSANFLQGSAYDTPLPAADAILGIGEVLTYHDDPAQAPGEVRAFFAAAADSLRPDGMLIFDLIETGEPSLSARFWASDPDWVLLVDTREDAASSSLEREIDFFVRDGSHYRRGRELHRVRLFDTADVTHWLSEAGFTVETAQSYGAQPLPLRRRAFLATRRG